MPLLLPTLAKALIELDEPQPPKTPEATAEAWFQAWWAFAKEMTYWIPGPTLLAAEQAAHAAFIPVLLPGCVPNPIPGIFYLALEGAILAGWAMAGLVPGALIPAYVPGIVPIVPAPGVLTAALVATAPIGLASPVKQPVRVAMATAINLWTYTLGVIPVAGPPPVPLA